MSAERTGIRLIGCTILVNDDYCDKPAEWRPANIPMAFGEWFCREHAVQIAQQEGVFGVYNRNSRDVVEELQGGEQR